MADSDTVHWGLTKPEVGSSRDTWGAKLNADWDSVDAIMAALCPIGTVADFAGPNAPSGWLLCDGTVVSVATYPKLFAAIGNTYGGDGATTFAVPDCRGRVTAGVGNTTDAGGGVGGFSLGVRAGWFQYTITQTHLPNYPLTVTGGTHDHTGATDGQGLHAHNGSTDAQGDHTHTYSGFNPGGAGAAAGSPITIGGQANTGTAGSHSHNITTTNDGFHAHSIATNSGGAHSHTVMLGGSGGGFPIYQPLIAFNKIIFAGPPGHTSLSTPLPGAPALMASPMRGVG